MTITTIYTIYLAFCSVFAFFLYGADKRKARKDKWRVSEKMLLTLSMIGGGIGGYFAMHVFRHKTKHWYFHLAHVFAIVWQVALWAYLYGQFGF